MSLANLLVRDVTILRAGTGTDRYGNAVLNWATATSSTMTGWLARDSEAKIEGDRDELQTTWTLRLPALTDITGYDRVVIDGTTYEVFGAPNHPWTPRGEHHVRVPLRLVQG